MSFNGDSWLSCNSVKRVDFSLVRNKLSQAVTAGFGKNSDDKEREDFEIHIFCFYGAFINFDNMLKMSLFLFYRKFLCKII